MRLVSNKLGLLAMIAGLSLWGTACNKSKVNGGAAVGDVAGANEEANAESAVDEEAQGEDEFAAGYGLLNFRQLAATFESLTGVQLDNNAVLAEYEKQLASLPKSFDAASISAAKISAATKLAATYCNAMGNNDALLTARFQADGAGLEALSSAEYSSTLLEGFYGPETALQGDRATDVASVTELVDMARAVVPENNNGNPAPASAVFMGVCASIISSAEFLMY